MKRALFLAALLAGPAAARAADRPVEGRIVYVTVEELYADVGQRAGLEAGMQGVARRNGEEIARVQVVEATQSTARLRVVSDRNAKAPRAGDRVHFVAHKAEAPAAQDRPEEFVPLLAPQRRPAESRSANLFHGSARLRHSSQRASDGAAYSASRLGTDGSWDRMSGSGWSLQWSGQSSYKDGDAFSGARDYRKPAFDLFRLSLQRPLEAGGFVRLGRFLPQELASLGYVDGAQAERAISPRWRMGNVAGLKPTRGGLEASGREPLDAAYATLEAGRRRSLYYSGTFAFLGTLYRGRLDRTAALHEQQIDLGARLSLNSSAEMDFAVPGSSAPSASRLTRMSVYQNFAAADALSFRAGLDHYERPVTRAELEFLQGGDASLLTNNLWRYWLGSGQDWPGRFHTDQEVSFLAGAAESSSARWRAGIAKSGFFFTRGGRISASAYNFFDSQGEAYGGSLSGSLPVVGDFLSLEVSSSGRLADPGSGNKSWKWTDVTARMELRQGRNASLYAGATQGYGDDRTTALLETGLNCRW